MWRTDLLSQQKVDTIYFDAYAADYIEDPFVAFSGEILELLRKEKGIDVPSGEFKNSVKQVARRLTGLGAKILVRTATAGVVKPEDLGELKEIGSDAMKDVSDIAGELVEKRIEEYTAEKDALVAFRQKLSAVAKAYRQAHGFPLTIIVDELDRCRPSFALSLLERIKHLFEVEGVAFVLLVNLEQLQSYVRTVYGDVDAAAYLLKFGNLFVDLPTAGRLDVHVPGRAEYCCTLFDHYDLHHVQNSRELFTCFEALIEHFQPSLRETQKIFVAVGLFYGAPPPRALAFLAVLLAILKVTRAPLYERVRDSRISLDEFFEETRIDRVPLRSGGEVAKEWALDLLRCCLLADAEYDALPKSEPRSVSHGGPRDFERYVGPRKRVIPIHCQHLDRFSTKPKPA